MSKNAATTKRERTLLFKRTAGPVFMKLEDEQTGFENRFLRPIKKTDLLYLRAGAEPFHALHRYFVIGEASYCGYAKLSASRISSFFDKLDLEGNYFGLTHARASVYTRTSSGAYFEESTASQVALIRIVLNGPIADIKISQVNYASDLLALSFEFKVLPGAGVLTEGLNQAFASENASKIAADIMLKPFKYERNRRGGSFIGIYNAEDPVKNAKPYHLGVFECEDLQFLTVSRV